MAGKRIGIMDIQQLLGLKDKGMSNRKCAGLLGVHRNSVNYYVGLFQASGKTYRELKEIGADVLHSMFESKGTKDKRRYEALSKQFEYYRGELKKPGCTRQTLWGKYLIDHAEGYSYTQFTHHLGEWLNRIKASGKLDHKAGDKMYVDYTGKKLCYVDKETGEEIEVEVFVAILPCSHYTYVEASRSQKKEDFIESINNSLAFFGGVPQAIVTDNLKSAVSKASKYEPVLNKTFKHLGLHYRCVLNPTRAYSPQDKALVERSVTLVYQRIFYALSEMTFFSLKDLNKEIRRLLEQYNKDYLLSNIKLSRHQQFQTIEKSYLSPLASERYQIKEYKRATVQKMGYVLLWSDRCYYSVPYRYIGKKVEVRYDSKTVEVYYKEERLAVHSRSYHRGKYNTIKEHLSSTHRYYSEWSPTFFTKLAGHHGSSVVAYITALIEQSQYPETAYKQCSGIISLGKQYEQGRLENACKRGLRYHRFGYHIIKNILDNKVDMQEDECQHTTAEQIPNHKNIRGADYFEELLKSIKLTKK